MRTTPTQAVKLRLDPMGIVERAEHIEALRNLLFEYELDGIFELESNRSCEARPCCPHCGGLSFSKYGRAGGNQRYVCKDCGRTFSDRRPRNLVESSRLPRHVWMKYVNCFVDGLPVARCAANCGVSVPTAYAMRLKILSVIEKNLPEWHVGPGQKASLDELFLLENFKGNRTKCKDFEMPRLPFERGRRSAHGPKRENGISHADYLCVMSGIDGRGRAFFDVATRGSLKKDVCRKRLEGRIEAGATVFTDDHSAYECLEGMGVRHESCVSTVPEGEINRVNTLHSALRAYFAPKRGVSSRRLHLYLSEFTWRWSRTRAAEPTQEVSKRVASQIAATDCAGIPEKLANAPYPFIDWWHGSQGDLENKRRLLAARQLKINRDLIKGAGDPEIEAEARMRQKKLDLDVAESGIAVGSVGKKTGKKASTPERRACTAAVLRGGRKPNAAAVRKYLE